MLFQKDCQKSPCSRAEYAAAPDSTGGEERNRHQWEIRKHYLISSTWVCVSDVIQLLHAATNKFLVNPWFILFKEFGLKSSELLWSSVTLEQTQLVREALGLRVARASWQLCAYRTITTWTSLDLLVNFYSIFSAS